MGAKMPDGFVEWLGGKGITLTGLIMLPYSQRVGLRAEYKIWAKYWRCGCGADMPPEHDNCLRCKAARVAA